MRTWAAWAVLVVAGLSATACVAPEGGADRSAPTAATSTSRHAGSSTPRASSTTPATSTRPTPTDRTDPTPTTRTTATTDPGSSAVSDLRALLETLTVAPEGPRAGYDRDLFPHWDDEDGDGCDTRCEVLAAERRPDGSWFSLWDGYATTDPSELDIDHVVALAEAWDSGAASWPASRRDAFADWQGNLVAVSSASNVSKSDRDAAEWFPSRAASNCVFAEITITTKARWGLAVDPAEQRALGNLLRTCSATSDPVPAQVAASASGPTPGPTGAPTPPVPTPTTVAVAPPPAAPATSGCASAGSYRAANGGCLADFEDAGGDVDCGQLPAAMRPVTVLDPADPYRLDGDHDGTGCDRG